jgi:hypothetical protein
MKNLLISIAILLSVPSVSLAKMGDPADVPTRPIEIIVVKPQPNIFGN